MPKLVAECLEVALQVSRHLEIVFQSEGLQSPWQSVRQGRTNFRGMCEMVFQSEELQSMRQSVDDTTHFEAFEGRRRAGGAGGRRMACTSENLAGVSCSACCGTLACSGATSFAACGDGLSERGASEPVAERPTGAQHLSRYVGAGLPE